MTLLELMIVIVVIGILIALLIPATVKMRNRASAVKEKSVRVTFLNAVLNYHAEYGVWPVADPPDSTPKVYKSSLVITQLRSIGNARHMAFWEGEDEIKTMDGQEYSLRINPLGKYPIGESIDEFSPAYTVSVVLE
jgi:type II secretory pathway pseudopilin PulG